MKITFACGCGRELRADQELAGKKARCPQCLSILRIPQAELSETLTDLDDGSPYGVMPSAPRPIRYQSQPVDDDPAQPASPSTYHPAPRSDHATRFRPTTRPPEVIAPEPSKFRKAKKVGGDHSLLEYSYLLLFFALVPLMVSLLGRDNKADFADRFAETIATASPEDQERIKAILDGGDVSRDAVIAAMPGGKLRGAHLARETSIHWIYAAIAAVAYLLLLCACFSVERANLWHLLGIGAFTSTVGIVFLLAVQFCSNFRIGGLRGGRGIGLIIMLILAFIGWSYNSAEDPESGFLLSALGFTCGVGLCEEFTKAIPLFFAFQRHSNLGWRTACLWGLASGVGFGVAEGVLYSARHYNGISGGEIYLVRFISCVALHAMWSASVGIAIARNVDDYEGVEDAAGFTLFAIRIMAVPMVLHGLYDTLLKKDMNAYALVVALLSYGWLAWHVELARKSNPKGGRVKLA